MGLRTLSGQADGTTRAAAMYDSVTGWMIGPIFEAEDADDQIEAFLEWLGTMRYFELVDEIGLESRDMPVLEGSDPRHWNDGALEKLVAYWRREHVEDGQLKQEATTD